MPTTWFWVLYRRSDVPSLSSSVCEYESSSARFEAMGNVKGRFPVILGMRLRLRVCFYGLMR